MNGLLLWFRERFPPLVYTALVAVFVTSGHTVAGALGGDGARPWMAYLLVWLVFLRLRLLDESKDYAEDVRLYPERVLSRGIVQLSLLERLSWLVLSVELALALALGGEVPWAWGLTAIFTYAMRYEFGVGAWLRRHLVLYALTHNPVVAGITLIIAASSGGAVRGEYGAYVALASLGSLAFEIGRKFHLPAEERPGVVTYTSALGMGRARGLLAAVLLAAGGASVALGMGLGASIAVAVAGAGIALAPSFASIFSSGKKVEAGSSLTLMLLLLEPIVLRWL